MKRLLLLTLLFLFTSASAEILTIWDDVGNRDDRRPPAGAVYRINNEIVDPNNPPVNWQAITADAIPGYTVTGPLLQNDRVIFIHHHKPVLGSYSVTNEIQCSSLTIVMKATDPGPDEEFRVKLNFSAAGNYKCVTGDTEITVRDGSVLSLQDGQTATINAPCRH